MMLSENLLKIVDDFSAFQQHQRFEVYGKSPKELGMSSRLWRVVEGCGPMEKRDVHPSPIVSPPTKKALF